MGKVLPTRLREFLLSRLGWIQKQQARFLALPPPLPKPLIKTGELHLFQGKQYCLNVIAQAGRYSHVEFGENNTLNLYVRTNASFAQREAVLHAFYREHLQREIPLLIAKWQPIIKVSVANWGVKKMKTRWGSCNIRAHRIWLGLELAKYSPQCLEYAFNGVTVFANFSQNCDLTPVCAGLHDCVSFIAIFE